MTPEQKESLVSLLDSLHRRHCEALADAQALMEILKEQTGESEATCSKYLNSFRESALYQALLKACSASFEEEKQIFALLLALPTTGDLN